LKTIGQSLVKFIGQDPMAQSKLDTHITLQLLDTEVHKALGYDRHYAIFKYLNGI